MNVFVTGGTGMVGKALVRRLVADGHRVHALGRSATAEALLRELGAIPVRGELANLEAWAEALVGMEAVVHAASPLPSWDPWEHFETNIVAPTGALARQAAKAGVRRFVYLSSESVLQDRAPLVGANASTPPARTPNSFYGRAKKAAEESLRSIPGLETIILRPTFIWGEGCFAFEEVGAKVESGAFVWVDGGRAPFEAVHVDTVVEASVAALTRGTAGAVYLVTDDAPATFREFWERIFQLRGIPSPRRSVPSWLLRPVAATLQALWRAAGKRTPPPLTPFELAFASQPRRYDVSTTWAELGIRPALTREEGFARLGARG
ncbi:MAG: NAD-dependent epimerase/dehydratase family protein [Myxococcota bacterium]|nr:NAD-dependent epimerase/dehydratase family protein [Myxococcota bacterium]